MGEKHPVELGQKGQVFVDLVQIGAPWAVSNGVYLKFKKDMNNSLKNIRNVELLKISHFL